MTKAHVASRSTRGVAGRTIGAAAAILATTIFTTTVASAQPAVCLERDQLAAALDGRYSEKPIAVGLDLGGKILEIFASADGETWTMIMTSPEGTSCVIAAGEKWLLSDEPEV